MVTNQTKYFADDYELLADEEAFPRPPRRRRTKIKACFTIRRVLIAVAILPFLFLFTVLCSGIPPTYDDIRSFEKRLPQHNLSAAQAEQRLYLRFPDHLWGHGLNNILQEASVPSFPLLPPLTTPPTASCTLTLPPRSTGHMSLRTMSGPICPSRIPSTTFPSGLSGCR